MPAPRLELATYLSGVELISTVASAAPVFSSAGFVSSGLSFVEPLLNTDMLNVLSCLVVTVP